MKTTIVKWGNSQGVRLPKHLLESADIREQDTVEIIAENSRIVIKKVDEKPPRKSIKERFKNFRGTYDAEIIDWGEPMGNEIW